MTAIVVEDLVKRYGGFTAVAGVSFTAAPGEVTALLGPNGAGKTTTIEILEGFQDPSEGTVRVLGADPRAGGRAGRSWRARIGLVLQSTSLDAQLTVTEALTLFGGLYPEPAADRRGSRRHRHGGRRPDQDRRAERGPAQASGPGHRHHRAAGDAVPRRADHRPGPGGPAAALGGHREPHRGRDHGPAHHPLPGRGAAPGAPGHRAGRRAGGGGRLAGQAARHGRGPGDQVPAARLARRTCPPGWPGTWPTAS